MLRWHNMGSLADMEADVALQVLHLLSGIAIELKVPSKYHLPRYNHTLAKILVEYSLAVSNLGDPLLDIDKTRILFAGKGDCSNILCHFGRVFGCKV
ncbi:hypothetical protein AgCh_000070 [Apium graveolens]